MGDAGSKLFPHQDDPCTSFEPGQWVLCRNPKQAQGNFGQTWVGPCLVQRQVGENCYVVLKGGAEWKIHVDDLCAAPDPREGQEEIDPRILLRLQ
ncbi:hypothetical protein JTB14_029360 [Gonioctena quinquepunctata]|nr:hypothetical protein JTB14_029360 [Gonioctena quinquepunctata]